MAEPTFAPEVERLLAFFEANATRPFAIDALPQIRQRFSDSARDRTVVEGVSVEDVEAGGVTVRLYRPEATGPLPLHLWLHGGGFILGSALSGAFDGSMLNPAGGANRQSCRLGGSHRLAPERSVSGRRRGQLRGFAWDCGRG